MGVHLSFREGIYLPVITGTLVDYTVINKHLFMTYHRVDNDKYTFVFATDRHH